MNPDYLSNMGKVPDTSRNIWILGGTGFIGRSLLNYLSSDPMNRLHLLVHKNIPYRHLEKYNTITGSLDHFDLKWFDRYPPDVVFHLARMAGPGPLRRQIASRRGELANKRLLNCFRSLDKPPIVVYVSGSLMYGDQPGDIRADEFTSLNPVAFGRDYIRAEHPWMSPSKESGLTIKLVRPGWIVGPGSWFRVFFWNHFLQTGKVPVYGDGSQMMSLIQLDDLGGMIGKVPEMEPDVLNLFAGNPVTQLQFSKKMADILSVETENISFDQIRKKYGKAETEALSSSIPLKTVYPEQWAAYQFLYPKPEDMLIHTISLLQSEKGVFTKTPKGSPG